MKMENSPWMRLPLDKLGDDTVSRVVIYKAAGCGGTYIGEIDFCYTQCMRPGNYGYQTPSKPKSQDLADRLFSKLEKCPQYEARKKWASLF